MKTQSAKAKGRRLQQWVRDQVLESYPKLTEDDVRSTGMGQSGADLQLSAAAKEAFPFEVECKNQERLNLWQSFEQCESNAIEREPLLIVKKNCCAPLAVVDAEWLFENLPKLNRRK
jgi:hypothetical protein